MYIPVLAELVGVGVATCDGFSSSLDVIAYNSTRVDIILALRGAVSSTLNSSNSSNSSSTIPCVPEGNATGGFRFELYGWGIDPAVHHECHFTDVQGNVIVAQVVIENSTALDVDRAYVASVPRWPYDAGLVNVTLVRTFVNTADPEAVPYFNLPVEFLFKQRVETAIARWFEDNCVDDYSSSSVIQASCWPTNVTVSGAGFHSKGRTELLNRGDYNVRIAMDYSCAMVKENILIQASFVTVPSPSELICWFDYDNVAGVEYGSTIFTLDLTYGGTQLIQDH